MRVERDVAVEQRGEHVHRPVDESRRLVIVAGGAVVVRRREVIEDLPAEHVDAAVGQVRESLRRLRLLLEALDPPVVARDHDSELGRVLDALGGDGEDRPALDVGVVCLAHRAQVDVGERIAGDDQEGLGLAQEIADLADPAGGAEGLGLVAVGDPQSEGRTVAERLSDLLGEIREVGDDVVEAVLREQVGDPGHDRPVQHRRDRLRHHVGERPQSRAQPGRKNHRPHRATGSQTAAGVAFGLTPSTIDPTKPDAALPLRPTSELVPPACA